MSLKAPFDLPQAALFDVALFDRFRAKGPAIYLAQAIGLGAQKNAITEGYPARWDGLGKPQDLL